jgi:hypothetical protein
MLGTDYNKIKKGDIVYIASDDGRRAGQEYEGKVVSVGSKYITIERYGRKEQFSKETGYMKDWSEWKMYPSKEDYKKEKEADEKRMYINHYIDYAIRYVMTFDEIDQIYNIVKKYKDKK